MRDAEPRSVDSFHVNRPRTSHFAREESSSPWASTRDWRSSTSGGGLARGLTFRRSASTVAADIRVYDDIAGGMLSPDGTILGVVGVHGVVGFWPLDRSLRGRRLPAIVREAGLVGFSPDSRRVVISEVPYAVAQLYDVERLRPIGPRVTPHSGRVSSAVILPDGATMALGGTDGTLRLWNVTVDETPDDDPLWRDTASTPIEPIVSPDGRIVTATPEGVVRVIGDGRGGDAARTIPGRADFVELSPDGRLLVTADHGRELVTVWDVDRGTPIEPRLRGELYPVGFSPDGRHVLFGDCCFERPGSSPLATRRASAHSTRGLPSG